MLLQRKEPSDFHKTQPTLKCYNNFAIKLWLCFQAAHLCLPYNIIFDQISIWLKCVTICTCWKCLILNITISEYHWTIINVLLSVIIIIILIKQFMALKSSEKYVWQIKDKKQSMNNANWHNRTSVNKCKRIL